MPETAIPDPIVLASGSETRATMLRKAGVEIDVRVPRIDEESLRGALAAEGAGPRDIADALAEMKARRVAEKVPGRWVVGSDQVLDMDGHVLSKASDPQEARAQLSALSGKRHSLLSAAVLFDDGTPIWRHVGAAWLTMRPLSEDFIADYVDRNWENVRNSVGVYRIEDEGVRLFSRIEGDHFTILGFPLIEFLSFLTIRGKLRT
jgi:septum formation protein